mmetsp:Transcript_70921/g.217354  ORF Transcript_70921/g.217354 Transcript_70921/m.217354 type:complete len:275 (-) Transcript_70921:471-1295(-)
MNSASSETQPGVALDINGAQSPMASSCSDSEDGSDRSDRPGRSSEFQRAGLIAAMLAGVALLGLVAAAAAEACGVQEAPFAIDGEDAPLFAALSTHRHGHRHRHQRLQAHVAFASPATLLQSAPEQPSHCNGTALVRGKQGCCAGKVFELRTSACCGTIPYYFTSLSCCAHGDGFATMYEPYAQNCCDDPAVSNVERGICKLEPGERSCCTRMQHKHRRRRRQRIASPRHTRGAWMETRSLSEAQLGGGDEVEMDEAEEEEQIEEPRGAAEGLV